MKPLNQAERRRAFFRFFGIYLFSLGLLVLPLLAYKILNVDGVFQRTESKCQKEKEQLVASLKALNGVADTLYLLDRRLPDANKVGEKEEIAAGVKSALLRMAELKIKMQKEMPSADLSDASFHSFELIQQYHTLIQITADALYNSTKSGAPDDDCRDKLADLKSKIGRMDRNIRDILKNLNSDDFLNKKKRDGKEREAIKAETKAIETILNSLDY